MAKRRNYRPRPTPQHKLRTIKDIIVGPDGVEHEFDPSNGWMQAVNKLYPGKRIHGERAHWAAIKEDTSRMSVDGVVYDVQCEEWVLEPHGHEMGPSPNNYLRQKIQKIIDELEKIVAELDGWREKLTRIPEARDDVLHRYTAKEEG
jgi:hypothetical protein